MTEQKHDDACGASRSDAVLEGDLYTVACGLSKHEGLQYITSLTLHVRFAASEDEAKGAAVAEALKMKPGFSVHEVLCLKIEQPSNAQGKPTAANGQHEGEND